MAERSIDHFWILGQLLRISGVFPLLLVDSENFVIAKSLLFPVHIQPEWYYLMS